METCRYGDWMATFGGTKFYPLEPFPSEIKIEDIAHSLALQCRFNGHCKNFYSVAEHSLIISSEILKAKNDKKLALMGLLHDASEAYLGDIIRPIKYENMMSGYRAAEVLLQTMIYERFGLPATEPQTIREYDISLLALEIKELTSFPNFEIAVSAKINIHLEVQLTPVEAERNFLRKFNELYKNIS
jgi:hypothetical protein